MSRPGKAFKPHRQHPLTSGSYIGLRTINTRARFDDIQANKMQLSYLHSDHLGSNSLMTDAAGNIIPNSQAAYLPFGDWRNEPTTSELTDVGYTGHRHNNTASNDLGLIYMNARYYVPTLARFASADTLIPDPLNSQSHNRFSYVYNNPLRFTDPSGHCGADTDESVTKQCEELQEYLEGLFGITIKGKWTFEELQFFNEALDLILAAFRDKAQLADPISALRDILDGTAFKRKRKVGTPLTIGSCPSKKLVCRVVANAVTSSSGKTVTIYDGTFIDSLGNDKDPLKIYRTLIHEIGHVWDNKIGNTLTGGLADAVGGSYEDTCLLIFPCGYTAPARDGSGDAYEIGPKEDWANTFADYVLGEDLASERYMFVNLRVQSYDD